MKKPTTLVLAILICEGVGLLGSFFTAPAISGWYAGLKKPSFNPPNWLFGPVWTLLYALMGVAVYLAWTHGEEKRELRIPLVVFGLQLGLNFLWSVLFFGLQAPFYGLIGIGFLWGAIVLTIVEFFRVFKPAGLILLPYLLWVSFAALLNGAIFRLNR